MPTSPDAEAPAIMKIIHHVRPGAREAFESTLRGLLKASEASSGRLGVDVIKPEQQSEDAGEWQVVLRYRTEDDLRAWRESRAATAWRSRLNALTIGAPQVERVHGLEAWFSLPDRRSVSTPPKWKMAIISAVVIYPLILIIPTLLAPLTRDMPNWLGVLVSSLFLTPLMTWVMMPIMTGLMKTWLYKEPRSEGEQRGS